MLKLVHHHQTFFRTNSMQQQFQNGPPKQKIQRLSKKGSVIAHGVIVLLFDSECIFMSKQTLMEDLFKLITNERRHKKGPFLLLSPVVIYTKFSSTAFSSASHSELNQEFTFVPHDLLKQFACHSSNMGSQSFSLPPCVTYLISSRLLPALLGEDDFSRRAQAIIFGTKFSRFLCNFHDYPRAVLREFFPSICIESSSKMRALIQITHRTTFRLAFSCFVMQRLNLIKCNAR